MTHSETFLIRRASAADAAVLGAMRAASHAERYGDASEREALFAASCTAFFARELAVEQPFVRAWLAFATHAAEADHTETDDTETDDAEAVGNEALGTAALTILPSLPRLSTTGPVLDARVRNVYVIPSARRRGIARALMRVVMDEFASLEGADRLTLGASAQGRPLYLTLGFVPKADELVLGP
jgi:GNAT superfamily N-acetyltransferase